MAVLAWLDRVVLSRRIRWTLRVIAVVLLCFGPIATAAFEIRHANGLASFAYAEVRPYEMSVAPEAPPDGDPAFVATRYLSRRSPAIDRLLPVGAGGVRFFEHLGGSAGMAFPGAAAIGLSASADLGFWPEAVELHERAHLIHAFVPALVGRLMSRLAPPAPDEYAATDAGEHFAEMAAAAWEVVAPPDGICVQESPVALLAEAEASVPGTAGFVAWYLRHGAPLDKEDAREALALAAETLAAPQRSEWEALWAALEARRLPDGTFAPWRHPNVRTYLESRRIEARTVGGWYGWLVDVSLLPSLGVLTLAGK